MTRTSLTTESNEFNDIFHIDYKGDRGLVGADIFQALSPDIQAELIKYGENDKGFSVLFRKDTVLFSTTGDFKTKYTDFFKSVELDSRDEQVILDQINSKVNLAEKILVHLDRL
jgi:hypothetical protein